MVDLAIIIVSFNTKELTRDVLKSIFQHTKERKFEVWVVDNASNDDSPEMIEREFPQVKMIKSETNLGFAKGNNLALKSAKANHYLLLNSDTKVLGSVFKILDGAKEKFDLFSAKLLNPSLSLQPNAGQLPAPWPLLVWLSGLDDVFRVINIELSSFHRQDHKYYDGDRLVGWTSATALLLSHQVIEKVGYFDEKLFMYAEDVDYCWRASRLGYKVGWSDQLEVIHLGGASSKQAKFSQWRGEFRGLIYLYRKNYGIIAAGVLYILIHFFIVMRMIVFGLIGRFEYTKSYAKIIGRI